jgi:hypothetical protein
MTFGASPTGSRGERRLAGGGVRGPRSHRGQGRRAARRPSGAPNGDHGWQHPGSARASLLPPAGPRAIGRQRPHRHGVPVGPLPTFRRAGPGQSRFQRPARPGNGHRAGLRHHGSEELPGSVRPDVGRQLRIGGSDPPHRHTPSDARATGWDRPGRPGGPGPGPPQAHRGEGAHPGPDDWRGISFGTYFRTCRKLRSGPLGATPKVAFGPCGRSSLPPAASRASNSA